MGNFTIRFAKNKDISAIMQYIDEYWRKGHILAIDRELFDWQYINYEKVNFVIGVDESYKIQGILGFIPYAKDEEKDIALALWKANQCDDKPFLGIELLMFLMKEETYGNIVCPGINLRTTSKIYQYMGMTVGTMEQWYRLRNVDKFHIAKITNNSIPSYLNTQENKLVQYTDFLELEKVFDFNEYKKSGSKPYKSENYFVKRYYNHPAYDYKVLGVIDKTGKASAIIVLRIQECNGARVVRFVDLIGKIESLKTITRDIDQLLLEWNAEYIDMYEVGVPATLLLVAGWLPVKESRNIIPNYFAPYEQCNVDINYCTKDKEVILFRGDGDQDRPN